MAKVNKFGKMDPNIKDIGLIIKFMDMEGCIIPTDNIMKGSG